MRAFRQFVGIRLAFWLATAELASTAHHEAGVARMRALAALDRPVARMARQRLANPPARPGEFAPTAQGRLIPAGSSLELLWNEGEFTEGPARAPEPAGAKEAAHALAE